MADSLLTLLKSLDFILRVKENMDGFRAKALGVRVV